MANESVIFFNAITIIVTFFAAYFVFRAKQRFEKGEFRRIVDWFYFTAVLFFLFQLIFNGLTYLEGIEVFDQVGPNFLANYRSLYTTVIALCFIKITYEIMRFSRIYGFAKVENEFFGKKGK
ncbi:MAG: hypothetical protein AABX01_03395 [Candidatus Micrarchaeota archaeon]